MNDARILLRKVAGSPRVSARRRIRAVDELSALEGIYFASPTDRLYAVPAKRAVMLIRRYLNSLMRGKAQAHRAIVADRIRHLNGETVKGLWRAIGDPKAKPEIEAKPSVADELITKYLGG